MWYSWGSPVALGIFLLGLGMLFKGLTARGDEGNKVGKK